MDRKHTGDGAKREPTEEASETAARTSAAEGTGEGIKALRVHENLRQCKPGRSVPARPTETCVSVHQSNRQNPPRQATPMSSLQHGVVLSHAAP
jgi:hypothetical protein